MDWTLGEPLTERAAALRPGTRTLGALPARAVRWREQYPFGESGLFEQRLAAAGVGEEEFLRVLDGEDAIGREPPKWAQTLAEAYAESSEWTPSAIEGCPPDALSPFLLCVVPLIDHFGGALRDAVIDDGAAAPYDARTVHQLLLDELLDSYKRMLAPTLVLELNVKRVTGRLTGATPTERFDNFIGGLDNRVAALERLSRYPVLGRQLVVRGEQWLSSSLAFLHDLAGDQAAIAGWLDTDAGRLTGIQSRAGDSHRGGRSVLIAIFDSGLHLVYKPRSLALDAHFQELVGWIDARADGLTFKTVDILDRGSHGWMEWARPADCESADGVSRFYERQGGYLALVHLLNGTDLHCENVIAAGEHPVLVDVEALFHDQVSAVRPGGHGVAAIGWAASVLRTGLLPTPMRWTEEAAPVDRSGLGAPQSQLAPLAVLCPEGVGTDEMRLVRKHLPIRPSAHWPTVAGQPAAQIDVDAIVRGFDKVYRTLLTHRDGLLAPDGPLAPFRGDEVRIVLRHTLVYSRLLAESFHPDALRDALDRDQLFDLLWADVPDSPHLGRVAAHECADLVNGDVPLFCGRVGSRAIESSTGQTIPDFLPEAADAAVRSRVLDMSDADLARQTWLIRASMATLDPKRTSVTGQAVKPIEAQRLPDQLIGHASRIGDRLEMLAFRCGDQAGWIGLRHDGKDEWSVRPVGPDLYDGTAGIVLFLAYLGTVTGEQRYRDLADAAVRNLRGQLAALPPAVLGIGAFSGWGGLIYLYSHLAVLWEEQAWVRDARGLIDTVTTLIDSDGHHDVMSGAAGCIAGLLTLHAVAPSDETITTATTCGDHLLGSAQRMAPGIGWPSTLFEVPLAGFSHGASGIATNLYALHQVTGQPRFADASAAALEYERSLFDTEQGHWADLRPRESRQAHRVPMVAWCHGAAGIGLSRLLLLPPDRRDVERAIDATLAWGFGDNHCLCHGDLGNLDFLLQVDHTEVGRLTRAILTDIEQTGWRCGLNKPVDTPGLMTGLAGIGYGMLRLADPEHVPPVTTLSPPMITASRG